MKYLTAVVELASEVGLNFLVPIYLDCTKDDTCAKGTAPDGFCAAQEDETSSHQEKDDTLTQEAAKRGGSRMVQV